MWLVLQREKLSECGRRREAPPGRDLQEPVGPECQLRKAPHAVGRGRSVQENAIARIT